MSGNQQNICFSVTIHKLTGYLRFTVYPQQWEHMSVESFCVHYGINYRREIPKYVNDLLVEHLCYLIL